MPIVNSAVDCTIRGMNAVRCLLVIVMYCCCSKGTRLLPVHVVERLVHEQAEGARRKHPRRGVDAFHPRRRDVHEQVRRRGEGQPDRRDQVRRHPGRQENKAPLRQRAEDVLVQEGLVRTLVLVPAGVLGVACFLLLFSH